jgi:ATP-binding cassette, subfamily C, type I secretion system permease/ATPase
MSAPVLRHARRDLFVGMALCLLLTLFIDIAVLVVPIFDMQLYDRVLQSRNMDTVMLLSVACFTGLAIYGVLDLLRSAALLAISDALVLRLRTPLLRHAVACGLRGEGGGAAQAIRDVEEMRTFLASGAVCVPLDAICAPLLLAVLFMLHPAYGFLGVLGASVLVLLGVAMEAFARPKLTAATQVQQGLTGELARHLRDPEVSEGLGMLPAIGRRWLARHAQALQQLRHAHEIGHALEQSAKIARLLLAAGVMILGAVMILGRATTPGSLMGANLLLNKLLGPFDHLVGSWRHWGLALAAWRRIGMMDFDNPAQARTPAAGAEPGLALHNVSFALPRQTRPILDNVSIAVPAGLALAVVGANGAGKSTLLRLLAGLITPSAGQITLDGAPLVAGEHIGYLPQGVALLDGTVGANIGRFVTDADVARHADAIAAARDAGVHELIGRLRLGYDTEIGADGASISGGQRQRIGLARALFGAPRLLVLDEPDASLDHEGDTALLAALATARARGSVVVITTHRPRLLAGVDLVLMLKEGRVHSLGPPPVTSESAPPARMARRQPA